MSDINKDNSNNYHLENHDENKETQTDDYVPRKTVGVIHDMSHEKLSEEEIIKNNEYIEPVKHRRMRKKFTMKKKDKPQLQVNPYTKYLSTPSSKHIIFSSSELTRRKIRTILILAAIIIAVSICIYMFV